jgi:hypothetical protein
VIRRPPIKLVVAAPAKEQRAQADFPAREAPVGDDTLVTTPTARPTIATRLFNIGL